MRGGPALLRDRTRMRDRRSLDTPVATRGYTLTGRYHLRAVDCEAVLGGLQWRSAVGAITTMGPDHIALLQRGSRSTWSFSGLAENFSREATLKNSSATVRAGESSSETSGTRQRFPDRRSTSSCSWESSRGNG